MIEFKYLFRTLLALYTIGWLLCTLNYLLPKIRAEMAGKVIMALSLPFHIWAIVIQGNGNGYSSLLKIPDVFLILSIATVFLYFLVARGLKHGSLGIVFPPFAIFLLHLFLFINQQSSQSIGFSQTYPVATKTLLFIHIISLTLGYILFCAATVLSLVFLYHEKKIKDKSFLLSEDKLPSLGWLDRFNYRAVAYGFLFMTVGILLGMAATDHSVGFNNARVIRFTLPLITWLVYGAFLLDRSIMGIRGKITAIWSILGFSLAIVTLAHEIIYLLNK